MTVEGQIREFLTREFMIEFSDGLDDTTDLRAARLIDSFSYVELVLFLRSNFSIEVSRDDLFGGRLNSVSSIAAIVTKQLKDKTDHV